MLAENGHSELTEVNQMSKMKHLKDKYFIEDDGLHVNKEACKKSAEAAMFDALIISTLAVGGLCAIGLARIGLQTLRLGAVTLREGATIVVSHLRK